MADIFISYARADRAIAKTFADAFIANGWTVWWDPDIAYGTQFDKVIETEIGRAKCVIALWSKRSVDSQWVRSEASEANQRGILVPIRIEADAKEPLEFRRVQTADLAGWDGDRDNPTFQRLLPDIERSIRSQGRPEEERVHPSGEEPRARALAPKPRLLVRLVLLSAPTIIALMVAGAAMLIHRPTAFNLELTVKGVSFTAEQGVLLLDKSAFTSLALHGVERGRIDANRAVLAEQRVDASSTSPRPIPVPIRIAARKESGATVIFAAPDGGGPVIGEFDQLFVPDGARVDLAVTPEKPSALSVRIVDRASRFVLSLRGESLVDLVHAKIESGTGQLDAAAVTLKLDAAESGSLVEMEGTSAGPTVLLTPPSASTGPAMLPGPLRVSALQFLADRISTVSGAGSIGFAEAEDARKITVNSGDFVVLSDLRSFYVRGLTLQPEAQAIRFVAGGFAGSLQTGPAGGRRERALTWFDSVWRQPWSLQLFALAVWLFPTTLAGYKLLKELRK